MKNMKVSKKLILSFGIILIFIVFIVFCTSTSFGEVNNIIDIFYNEACLDVQKSYDIECKLQSGGKNMLHAIAATDSAEAIERLETAKEDIAGITEDIEYFKENYDGDMADVEAIEADCKKIQATFEKLSEKVKANDKDGAFEIYKNEILSELASINTSIENIQTFSSELMDFEYDEGQSWTSMAQLIALVLGAGSIVCALALSTYITKMIVGGIKQAENAAQKMAEGDFDVDITYSSKDEIGHLVNSMRNLSDRTGRVITDIDRMLGSVAEGDLTVDSGDESMYIGAFGSILSSMN
ncbi:MAG: MCP four helix bundle domain-containing protein, partial [Oscillospiraceae bacterium]